MSLTFSNSNDEHYQPVASAYKTYLRIHTSITFIMFIGLAVLAWLLPWSLPAWIPAVAIVVCVVLWGVLVVFWVPRRFAVTQYFVAEDYIGYRVGALWHKEVAVTFNRLQHTELARGPIERWLGISRLLLYTAGGHGADLSIPCLAEDKAEELK